MGNRGSFSIQEMDKSPIPSKASQLEFAVNMTCNKCVNEIKEKLEGVPGISNVEFNLSQGSVFVETILPSSDVLNRIESAGKEAILRGVGAQKNMGAAVAMLGGDSGFSSVGVHGVVRLMQIDEDTCVVDGTIDGLSPGKHGLHVYECGDISKGCESIGEHYNPFNSVHGAPINDVQQRHAGDLGNIKADLVGRAVFRISDPVLKVWDVIGRSIAVTEFEDDFGHGSNISSKTNGNSGQRLACGIIARSAGLFENSKKICACDGLTLWDEKNKPLAGVSRQQDQPSRL